LGEHRLKDLVRSERVYQLIYPDLPADFPALKSLNAFPNNLPVQPTPFIGRQAEVKAGKDLPLFTFWHVRQMCTVGHKHLPAPIEPHNKQKG
jgi:hypothetical protein